MRKFEMNPNNEYQQKMTDSLYNADRRYNLDYNVLPYIKTHMTDDEEHKLLEGYLSNEHIQQLMSIQKELNNYSGPHRTIHISSMIESLCVEGRTSKKVDVNANMKEINWGEISGKYDEFDTRSVRSEYARVRKIARQTNKTFRIIVKSELTDKLNI